MRDADEPPVRRAAPQPRDAGLYPPGSTFKMVTAAAALDTGRFTPASTFDDPGYCEEYGKRVSNAGNPEAPETFGNVDLSTGFQHSINSVFCNIGKKLGAGDVLDYAKRFGFYSRPPLETPASERAASGLYDHGTHSSTRSTRHQVDPGRLAFGQERLLVTPLQMAMVAATVGTTAPPCSRTLIERVISPSGKTITHLKPDQLGRAIKRQTAASSRG